MKTIQTINIADLSLVRGTQVRAIRDHPAELRYKDVMEEAGSNEMFPPIIVFRDSDGEQWIADGHHRVAASMYANLTTIQADVRTGTKEAAIREAIIVNRNNGLPMTMTDRHNAMEMILETNPAMTNQALADLIGVGRTTILRWRENSMCPNGHIEIKRIRKDGKSYPATKRQSPKVTNRATTSARVSPVVSNTNSAQSPKPVASSGQPVPRYDEKTQNRINHLKFDLDVNIMCYSDWFMELLSIVGRAAMLQWFGEWLDNKKEEYDQDE